MTPEVQERYDCMIRFLEDQMALADGSYQPRKIELKSNLDLQSIQFDTDLVAALQKDVNDSDPVLYDPVCQIRREKITIGRGSRIDSFVKLEGGEGLTIGRYVHVASFAHIGIGGGITILEDFSAVASGGRIVSGSNMTDKSTLSACAPAFMQRVERKTTRIGRYACVFTNGVVLPGVTLHEGACLAAGGVATKDIPPWEIWGGVPARKLADRLLRPDDAYLVKEDRV